MTNEPPAWPVRLAMAVLTPALDDEDEPDEVLPPPDPAGDARRHDPFQALADFETAWVEVVLLPEEGLARLDLPYKDIDDLYELLETLYLLRGWKAVDDVCEAAETTLVGRVSEILGVARGEVLAITDLLSSNVIVPPDHVDLVAQALGVLIARAETRTWPGVIAGLKAVVPFNGLFSHQAVRPGHWPTITADPEVAARLYSDAVVALERTRGLLASRIRGALRRAEREAKRILGMTLTDARTEIVRETVRYFDLEWGSVEPSLENVHNLQAKTDKTPGKNYPLAKEPEALQAALKKLTPFAKEVLALDSIRLGTPPTPRKAAEADLRRARAAFAREVGRLAQEFPILSQIPEKVVKPASEAKPAPLGAILFPILARAHAANRAIQSQTDRFGNLMETLADARHPEQDLAKAVKRIGKRNTVWGYAKYIERAIARAPGDDITRKALANTLGALEAESGETAKALAQGAAEMAVLGATAHFAEKFVPVLNVALAAWHIGTAVTEFGEQNNEFYCALDPRDSLIPAAPSVAGLALDVATEAAFAFI